MTNNLGPLLQKLGYQFRDEALLEMALTHRSIRGNNNERFEFLGDAIVNFLIAEALYQRYPKAREGRLSRLRALLVNGDNLASMAEDQFNLSRYMRMGPGEFKSGGHKRPSILADCLEAVIAAIYLDGGMPACSECVGRWFSEKIDDAQALPNQKDAKTRLQEWSQANRFELPLYEIIKIEGESHAQRFFVACRVPNQPLIGSGDGSSRRRAEQEAAKHYLTLLESKS